MQLFHIKTTVDSNVFSQKFEPHTLNFIDPIFSYTYIETIRVSFTRGGQRSVSVEFGPKIFHPKQLTV
jgi:hypothetical protein